MTDTNKVRPVAYWIPKAKQFCIAVESAPPFAKVWEPLYPASTLATAQQEIERLRGLIANHWSKDCARLVGQLAEAQAEAARYRNALVG